MEQDLTLPEKAAVSCLKKQKELFSDRCISENGISNANGCIEERLRKRRKTEKTTGKYLNPRLILGSVADVERLWSMSKYVLTENRQAMTPQMFEAIMFLKLNSSYWDVSLVAEAIRNVNIRQVDVRTEAHFEQEHIIED